MPRNRVGGPGSYNVLSKVCTSCKVEQPLDAFYFLKHGPLQRTTMCKPCHQVCNKQWAQKNKSKRNSYARAWNHANPLKATAHYRNWRKKNLAYDAMRQRERTALKGQAMPSWADRNKIKEIYVKCPEGHHVDHIIPLRGKTVSGLHNEFNLQYLLAKDNLRKRNLYAE